MSAMAKTKSNSLPENAALSRDQQQQFQRKLRNIKTKAEDSENPGVVYLGHIPHGFYEEEMKKYFSQFGRVNKLRLSRSRKSGRSRGYAFIEFESESVAKVVADTMDNYLMFNKRLQCKFKDSDSLHADTFKGSSKIFKPTYYVKAVERYNKPRTETEKKKAHSRRKRTLKKTLSKLAKKGIKYDFPVKDPKTT